MSQLRDGEFTIQRWAKIIEQGNLMPRFQHGGGRLSYDAAGLRLYR